MIKTGRSKRAYFSMSFDLKPCSFIRSESLFSRNGLPTQTADEWEKYLVTREEAFAALDEEEKD